MANSFGTVAVDVIAQEALTRLIQKLSFIKNVHRDFSTTSLQKGQDVVTHIITELASSDVTFGGVKAGGGTHPDGYTASSRADLTQTDVKITLDKHKAVTFTLTDGERDSSSIDMFNRYAEVAAYGLAKGIVDVLLGSDTLGAKAVTITNSITAGDLTMDKLIDLGAAFDADGIPEAGRWLVAHPKVLAELEKEVTAVTNATFSVNSSIIEGGVNRIRGFDIYAYNGGVLEDGTTAGDCSMVAGFNDSLALVTAPPSSPPDTSGASLAYITDPETGLTIQRRQWYDADKALYSFALTLYLGSKLTAPKRAYKMLAI